MSFWCLQFSQKKKESNLTAGTLVVKSNFFVCVWGESKIPKRHFEINWPLHCHRYLTNYSSSIVQAHTILDFKNHDCLELWMKFLKFYWIISVSVYKLQWSQFQIKGQFTLKVGLQSVYHKPVVLIVPTH